MKLNPKELKNVDYKKLALQHGEKAAMVVCGAILIWGVYSFFGAESSDVSPSELREKVERAKEHVENTNPPEVTVEGPFANLAEQRLESPIQVETVAWAGPLWQPVKSRGQREEPEYLAAVDPVVDADHVTVAIKAAGGAGVRIQRVQDEDKNAEQEPAQAPIRNVKPYAYVTVRYLVPLAQQIEAYRKARLGATMPFYYEFVLERQYLLPDGAWSEWEAVDLEPYKLEREQWASFAGPVVSPSATDEALTADLPSRIHGDWKGHGGHPKLVMVEDFFQPAEEQPEQQQKQTPAAGSQGKGGFAGSASRANQPQRGFGQPMRRLPLQQQQGGPGVPGPQGDMTGQGQGQGQQPFPQQSQQPRSPLTQRQPAGQGQPGPQGSQGALTEQSEWLLFRYLDLDVEPGQSYRYQLKLVLRNPNFEVEQELLMDGNTTLAEGEFRQTEWSEPTRMVTVPDNLRYAVYKGDNDGATLDVHLFFVDPELGSMAAADDKNPRPLSEHYKPGDMIAITGQNGWVVDMKRNVKVRRKDISASTGDALIDFFGGRKSLDLGPDFPGDVRDVTIPYTALVLDAQGDWVTRREEVGWFELNQRLLDEHNAAKDEKDDEEAGGLPVGGAGGFGTGAFGQGGFGQGGFGQQGQQGQQGQSRRRRP